MIKSYLKIAWRNFYRHKFYTGINVFGLALGMGCVAFLFLFVAHHFSFDTYHGNARRVYRIVNDLHIPDGTIEYDEGGPVVLAKALRQQSPLVDNETVFLRKRSYTVMVPGGHDQAERRFYEFENVAFTDDNFFRMFDCDWLSGNNGKSLSTPYTVVISQRLAQKYFGTDDALGRIISLNSKFNFTVTGVLQNQPQNTDLRADLFLSLPSVRAMQLPDVDNLYNSWFFTSTKNWVFVSLTNEAALATVNKQIVTMGKKAMADMANAYQYHLQPLADIHFNARYGGAISKSLLYTLTLVALLLIAIACVNFINLATAQSVRRAKEIGTRKVLGGSGGGIFWQFIAETAYIVITAALIALIAVLLLLPVLNNWLQLHLTVNMPLLVFLLLLIVMVIFAGGFYPAVILSRLKPVNALHNKVSSSSLSSGIFKNILVVAQNGIAQVLIIAAIVITLQTKYMQNADMGFDKYEVVMVPVPDNSPDKTNYLRQQLAQHPEVKSISFCYRAPASTTGTGGSIKYDNRDWETFTERTLVGDAGYAKTFGLKLIAGRDLAPSDTIKEYLVNQETLVKLGVKNPEQAIGRRLVGGAFGDVPGTIVGVVKNFNVHSLYTAIEPVLITTASSYYEYAGIKISGRNHSAALAAIQKEWQQVYPQNVFKYTFLDADIAAFYQKEETINKLIRASAIVAIAISCLGLLGLISLVTGQRVREIGIRKVLGASVYSIVKLITGDFMKLVLLAIAIGAPAGGWLMYKWLQGFAYRVDVQWWVFALSGMAAIVVALVTVSLQAVKAAVVNPVKSLKE